MKKRFILIVLFPALVLGYGYWHSKTHGSVNITLKYGSEDQALSKAEVVFMDSKGSLLAEGRVDDRYDFVNLIHPKIGDCQKFAKGPSTKEKRELWQECFEAQSTWIPKWIKKVRQLQVKHETCVTKKIPIKITEYDSDWLLWWVPHPHIGGFPYAYFRARVVIDKKDCIAM